MNNYYQLYIKDVYSLAETICIKFDDIAEAINVKVLNDYGLNSVSEDKYTWKYYQNISGMYHFSDTKISVVSLDTGETIEFNKGNLATHIVTKESYLFGTRRYKELIQQYPELESLILGILYPADIDNAINSRDGTILSYPQYLVDSNEYSFIFKLQTWIYQYVDRWINKQFSISDDLYAAAYLGQLCIHLVPVILNIRLQACKSNEAHNFHIRQHLASNNMLDVYLDRMTKQQALFFYRNIDYIQRNSGTRDTFDWLVENLMTNRALPLYEFTMKHDVSNMLPNDTNGQTPVYNPTVAFRRNAVSELVTQQNSTYFSLDKINNKILDSALGNEEYITANAQKINNQLQDSLSNTVATKLLESAMIDYTDSVEYPFEGILINHWLYWSTHDIYKSSITLTIPKTKSSIVLSARDCAILYMYLLHKTINVELANIPDITVSRVLNLNKPNISELKKLVESKYVNDELLNYIYTSTPIVTPLNSINSFYQKCREVYFSGLLHTSIHSKCEHATQRAQAQVAIAKLYVDVRFALASNVSDYPTWLNINGLDFSDYTQHEAYEFALSIIQEATGAATNLPISIKKIQKSMVEMLTLLSSYSIQIVSDIAQPGVIYLHRPSVRIGDIIKKESTLDYIDPVIVNTEFNISKEKSNVDFNTNAILPMKVFGEKEKSVIDLVLNVRPSIITLISKPDTINMALANVKVLSIDTVVIYSGELYGRSVKVPIKLMGDGTSLKSDITNIVPIGINTASYLMFSDVMVDIPTSINTANYSFNPPYVLPDISVKYFTTVVYS